MTANLTDKVALITGAGSGIGRASALAFARAGARVVVADIAVEGGEETGRLVRDAGGEAIFVKTDVAQASEVEHLIETTVATFGRLDCAFNNAGAGLRHSRHSRQCDLSRRHPDANGRAGHTWSS